MPRRRPTTTALLALALALATPAAAADRSCAVSRVEGPAARAWHGGGWSPLAPGPLPAGEVKIETGPDTRVEVACDDGIVVTVGVSTALNLESLGAPRRGIGAVLQLVLGIVGVGVPEGAGPVELRAPLAIASVRSTRWLVLHGEAGSAVFVREGRVAVRAVGGTEAVTLGPGQGVDAAAPGALGPVRDWGAPRIAEATARLGLGWR